MTWYNESRRHALAAKGIETGSGKAAIPVPQRPYTAHQIDKVAKSWKVLQTPLLPGEETEADELYLYTVNDSDTYRTIRDPAEKNMLKYYKKGIYDRARALLQFMRVAEFGAKRYDKEFGTGHGHIFTPKVRIWAAKHMLDDFESNYDIK